MALNYSHRPVFPAHIAEDNLVSPMRIVNGCLVEGIPERSAEGFERSWYLSREIEDCINYGRDIVDGRGSSDSASNDIVDRLPSDPFGMGITTAFTIKGWLEDLEADYARCGLGVILNNAVTYKSFPANTHYGSPPANHRNFGSTSGVSSACSKATVRRSENKTSDICRQISEGKAEGASCSFDANDGAPHEALSFVLGYLGIKDLLSVEMTCRSLCYTVRNDPLLWRRIHIDKPMNERITDDSLLRLTSRSQGNLHCLSLLECSKITDDGLRRVVESNPRLNKLCVPACTRLSIEGVVSIVKTFNCGKGSPGIRYLRIGGIYGVTPEHFETLKFLLDTNERPEQKSHKPHFYIRGNIYLLCDDDRAIDVEVCPRCQKLRLVYDCPSEGCQGKDQSTDSCRACALCIARCSQCGRCIDDNEYEENFCLELLCSDCKAPW